MCMKGFNFSHVKFYHDLSAGLKKIRENLKIAAIIGRLPVQYWKRSSFDNGSSVKKALFIVEKNAMILCPT